MPFHAWDADSDASATVASMFTQKKTTGEKQTILCLILRLHQAETSLSFWIWITLTFEINKKAFSLFYCWTCIRHMKMTPPLLHIHYITGSHHTGTWFVIPLLCWGHTALSLISARWSITDLQKKKFTPFLFVLFDYLLGMHDIGYLPKSNMPIFLNSLWPIPIYFLLFGNNNVSPVQKL